MRFAFFALLAAAFPLVPLVAQQSTLRPFESDVQLLSYFRSVREAQEHEQAQAAAAAKCRRDAPSPRTIARLAPTPAAAVILGRVVGTDGQPIASVRLSLDQNVAAAVSDANGQYRIVVPAESLSKPRAVTIQARMIGYAVESRSLMMRQRDSVMLDVRLCAQTVMLEGVVVSGAAAQDFMASRSQVAEAITNVQHAGVDEGGIVKVHGDHFVILRRGRLFTVAIGAESLRSVAVVNAFGPDVDPNHAWYDELLIGEDKVVVVGYSYQRGGTEIGVFKIDPQGRLKYEATYQLRSNDYYSSRNYASRLIGSKLIFYAPLYLWGRLDDPFSAFPALRRWDGKSKTAFRRIVPAAKVYRAATPVTGGDLALHTVTMCDLAAADLACEASVIVGPSGRVFYVSKTAVYIWASPWSYRRTSGAQRAMLYRMPLDGAAPTALGVTGAPIDQFSFLETDDNTLNVLIRSAASGEGMWHAETSSGAMGLLQVPLTSFGDGSDQVPWWRYRRLPDANGYVLHNRFVGDHLLYGVGSGWGRPQPDSAALVVVQLKKNAFARVQLLHGVDRIEVMGRDALIVGADRQDLHFTGIRLEAKPQVAQQYTMKGASQGELRSHGFFYRSDDEDSGVLGLPVSTEGRPGYRHLFSGSAGIVFVRNEEGQFKSLGVLSASEGKRPDDHCRASCVDWYGNARPIFLRGRIFALLGYEIVEGAVADRKIRELRRISYTPGRGVVTR